MPDVQYQIQSDKIGSDTKFGKMATINQPAVQLRGRSLE